MSVGANLEVAVVGILPRFVLVQAGVRVVANDLFDVVGPFYDFVPNGVVVSFMSVPPRHPYRSRAGSADSR